MMSNKNEQKKLQEIFSQFTKGQLPRTEVINLLNDKKPQVRRFALSLIREKPYKSDLEILIKKLEDPVCISPIIEIIYDLVEQTDFDISQKELIEEALKDRVFDQNIDEITRIRLLKTLSHFLDATDISLYRKLINNKSSKIRLVAIQALIALEDSATISTSLNDSDEIRLECIKYLIRQNNSDSKQILEREFKRGSNILKRNIIQIIGDNKWTLGLEIIEKSLLRAELQVLSVEALESMNSNEEALLIILKEGQKLLDHIKDTEMYYRNISLRYISSYIGALTKFNDKKIIPLMEKFLQTEYSPCFPDIFSKLSRFDNGFSPELTDILLNLLRDFMNQIDIIFQIIGKISETNTIEKLLTYCYNCGPPEDDSVKLPKTKIAEDTKIQPYIIRTIAKYPRRKALRALSNIDQKRLHNNARKELLRTIEELRIKKLDMF